MVFYQEPQKSNHSLVVGYQLDDEPILYIGNACFTKHPFVSGCLGYQVLIFVFYAKVPSWLTQLKKYDYLTWIIH